MKLDVSRFNWKARKPTLCSPLIRNIMKYPSIVAGQVLQQVATFAVMRSAVVFQCSIFVCPAGSAHFLCLFFIALCCLFLYVLSFLCQEENRRLDQLALGIEQSLTEIQARAATVWMPRAMWDAEAEAMTWWLDVSTCLDDSMKQIEKVLWWSMMKIMILDDIRWY